MVKNAATPIRFRGTPRSLEGLATLAQYQVHGATLALNLSQRATQPALPLALQTEPIGSAATRLRFVLPESTPPGTYEGTVEIDGANYPVVVEVEPHPYLVVSPRQLVVQVEAGKETSVEVTLVNSGNVPCEIDKVYAFGLFDVEGAERAIGVALRDSSEEGRSRLDRLLDEAADNHAGLVRVAVREGQGSIEPGEVRNVRATLRFSDRLKPGHVYGGTWPMLNLRYSVQVQVSGTPPAKDMETNAKKESS